MTKGIIGIISLILGLFVTIAIVGLNVSQNNRKDVSVPTLPITSPSPIPSPTPTSTPVPTPAPAPTPTLVPSSTPTPKPVSGPPGAGLSTITVATEVGNFRAAVLSLDLTSGIRIITDTANDSDCQTDCPTMPLAEFVVRNGGFAGVNGTYFCPATYEECGSKKDSFDFPVYNSRLQKWVNSDKLFWNSRSMLYFDGSGVHYLQNANSFGGGLVAGIVNYPGLVDGGNVQIDDSQSGLSDKQKGVGTKVGIGTRGPSNVMVVIAYGVNTQQFANVFKALGATGALNLDTGGSTALYYNGRYAAGPGRNLPNAIVFAR